MRRLAGIAIALLAALSACSAEEQRSLANRFDETENAIANTADAIESGTANAIAATGNALDPDAIENRIDAIDVIPGKDKAGNSH